MPPVTGTLEVGGAGYLGIGVETTLGTFVTPTKFFPIRSETLSQQEAKIYRTNIRGVADRSGAVQGYVHAEGDVVFEVTSDILPYFLEAGRFLVVRTGASAPFTYTATPIHVAKTQTNAPATAGTPVNVTRKTLTLLANRSDIPMAYLGMSVSQLAFTLDNGLLVCTASMIGTQESTQTPPAPVATWGTAQPFGPGLVTLEVPQGSPRADADTFSVTINDNGVAANRLNGARGAAYVNWGEREITAHVEHDFSSTADYDAFVAQTQQIVAFKAIRSASDSIEIDINAAIEDNYAVNLSALGDVVRGSFDMHGIYGTTDAVTIIVKTTESVL
jgi:hypothetical protein